MKKISQLLFIAMLAPALSSTAQPAGHAAAAEVGSGPLQVTSPPRTLRAPARVITDKGFLYESFESVPDGSDALPEGWTATSTPGLPNDIWHTGTLGRDGTPLNGVSGYKYAYILGNRESDASHDAWLFSPGLYMEAGTEYTIEFFALMPPVTGSDDMEILEVCLGRGANSQAMVETLDLIENDNDYWRYYGYSFTPEESGTYHIGFHSLSPANSNSTVIDDLKISSGPLPIYSAFGELDLGLTDELAGTLSAEYRISNGGQAPLEVSLLSASDGVSVEGLPATLDPYDDVRIKVTARVTEPGDWSGVLTLATNDPTLPSVPVSLSGKVEASRVTGYLFENFENGGPEGWKLSFGSANVAAYGGYNSSRAYYTTTAYGNEDQNPGWGGVGFMTHYVEMGDDPEISFWYQMAKVDFTGAVTGVATSEEVEVYVQVSRDGGNTFDTVYEVKPGGEHEHVSTLDFANIRLSVPQYAGERCRVRVVFNQPGASFFNQVRVLADDVSVGTKVANDLRATSLLGETLLTKGSAYVLEASIDNLGEENVSDYNVELLDAVSGEKLASVRGVEVQGGGNATVSLSWTPEKEGPVSLAARIFSDSDPNEENNTSYTYHAQVLPDANTAIAINHGDALKAMAFPINFYAVESMTQSIFPANEIGTTSGVLNSLVFTTYLESDFYGEPFTVFIGETDKADFADNTIVDPSTLTKVFDGTIYMPAGMNDLVIPFSHTYDWHGGNLVVMCQKLGKEFVLGQNFIVHKTIDQPRSIQSNTHKAGTLVESGYADASSADVYPEIRFNMVKAPAGKVSGVVSDSHGPVADARVSVGGTQRYEITDASGCYSFSEVASGDNTLKVTKHGYYDLESDVFALGVSASEVKNLTITALPRYTLQGTVTSASTGEPIENVRVELKGYDDFVVMTDDAGHYTVADVAGDTGKAYALNITNGYFKPVNTTADMVSDKTFDCELTEKALRVHNVKANATPGGNLVTWEAPMPEFRSDSGTPVDYIGWSHGNSEVIVGSAYRKKAKIKEISWYATNRFGTHYNFNVFVFGLDAEGNPDAKNILYMARNVDFEDNAWSTHILSKPVEANGFMIAVSCDGFMGIGICEPTDEYPFEDGQAFYAGDSYNSRISKMSTFASVHPMLRAYGEDDGDMTVAADAPALRAAAIKSPAVTYDVFRCADTTGEGKEKVGSTSDLSWYDSEATEGKYCYAIVATYPVGESEAVYSNLLTVTSVDVLTDKGVVMSYDAAGRCLRLSGSEKVAAVALYDTAGVLRLKETNPSDVIGVSELPGGVYVATVTLHDGTAQTYRLLKK